MKETNWKFDPAKYEGAVEIGLGEKPTTLQGIAATLDLYNDAPRILRHAEKLTEENQRLRAVLKSAESAMTEELIDYMNQGRGLAPVNLRNAIKQSRRVLVAEGGAE